MVEEYKMIIGLPAGSQGFGDLFTITPICKARPDCIVELPPKSEKFTRIFDGICAEIHFVENPVATQGTGTGHWSKQKLRTMGLPDDDYYPYIKVTEDEIARGHELIKDYEDPIVFISNCSKHWAHLRQMSQKDTQKLVDILSKDFTILQFGVASNIMKLDNVVELHDKSLEDLICYYAAIRKYVGVSTGDLFLMLAVGGEVVLSIPKQWSESYMYNLWDYDYDKISYITEDIEAVTEDAKRRWKQEERDDEDCELPARNT
jgi:hypothetical protein